MHRIARSFALFALLLASPPSGASFHLFTMNELYSNADGSVQFLELTALAGGQQFTFGHTLRVTQGSTSRTYDVPGNLPGDTSGKRFIFATQGFAALGIVTPDFVVPNGFFPLGNGTITWGEGADIWTYSGLPSDGSLSLNRDGSTGPNSPRNFAGQTGTVSPPPPPPPPPPALNYQALWWRSPAGSESGWGINITHQADILFATWFTYDTDGSGLWLVMPSGNKVGAATYSGKLYRTTGPAFSASPWNPSQVVATEVGSLSFTFDDANTGVMTYSLNGITQTKPITRQVYANPVATCVSGGGPGSSPNYQDLWWSAPAGGESGWGVNVTHQGDILFATWFTYGADGKGVWYVMSNGARSGTVTYSGALYRTTGPAYNASPWNPSLVTVTPVGNATFTFSGANNGSFAYTVNGVSQTKAITRQVFANPATVCR